MNTFWHKIIDVRAVNHYMKIQFARIYKNMIGLFCFSLKTNVKVILSAIGQRKVKSQNNLTLCLNCVQIYISIWKTKSKINSTRPAEIRVNTEIYRLRSILKNVLQFLYNFLYCVVNIFHSTLIVNNHYNSQSFKIHY
jgi:hypothetical protein